jgi:hypothetical protein
MDSRRNNPEFIRRIIPKEAASVAFKKGLADTKQITAQNDMVYKVQAAIHAAEEQTKEILYLESKIERLNMSISDKMITDMLKIDHDQQITERRTYVRRLRNLKGIPPSEKEIQEKELMRIFSQVSRKIGMPLIILEDIYESAEYAIDISAYWQSKIDMCTRISNMPTSL